MLRLTRLSFRANLLIAAVVPLSIFALCGGGVGYLVLRYHFETEARARLEAASIFLTQAGRLGLISRSSSNLKEPVHTTLADPDIVHVGVYGPHGELLYASGTQPVPPAGVPLKIEGPELRYRSLGPDLREMVRVVRYPEEEETPELLGFVPELDPDEARLGEPEGMVRLVMSTERQEAGYRRALFYSGLGILCILGAGALLAFVVSRGLVRGIQELAGAARRIGAGDFDVAISGARGPELEALAYAFNEMTGEIREYQHDMERKVVMRTAELNAARLEAERANQAKTQFLANMSHEIRTPLMAVLGYTDLLLDEESGVPPKGLEHLRVVKRNGTHLLGILSDILDISRIEAGRLESERIPMSPAQAVLEIVSLLRVRAEEKGLDFRAQFDTPVPTEVVSNPTRLRQVLMNLAGNAIKFTASGEVEIRVAYDADAEVLTMRIRDTGIGISEHKLPTLFQPFDQADSSMTRRFGGTGLGLAITKRLADFLGGDCAVESELGVGSTFTFTCRAPMPEGAELVEFSAEAVRDEGETSRPRGTAVLTGARILLAEDGPDNQRLLSLLLQAVGAEVVVVENGRLAVERVQRERFDLVLMDMAMPEMDGYEATCALRDMGVEIPIVALTAHAMRGDRERCLEAGCSHYLSKPVDRKILIATLCAALEKPNA